MAAVRPGRRQPIVTPAWASQSPINIQQVDNKRAPPKKDKMSLLRRGQGFLSIKVLSFLTAITSWLIIK